MITAALRSASMVTSDRICAAWFLPYREPQTTMPRLVALLNILGIVIGEHFMHSGPASKARWW
jgi:hypothetical protein